MAGPSTDLVRARCTPDVTLLELDSASYNSYVYRGLMSQVQALICPKELSEATSKCSQVLFCLWRHPEVTWPC